MKNKIQTGINIFFILVGSIIVGVMLLTVVYTLPEQRIENNVREIAKVYEKEGEYPQLISGYKMMQLDNFTDAIMLSNTLYVGTGNPLKEAMAVSREEYADGMPVVSLVRHFEERGRLSEN